MIAARRPPVVDTPLCPRTDIALSLSVIKTVWNVEESKRELPGLLRSSSPPEAIVAGGAYPKDAILEIQEACKGAGGNNVPWLVHATYWNGGRPTPGPGYNEEITNRVKKTLGEAVGGGKKSDIFKY